MLHLSRDLGALEHRADEVSTVLKALANERRLVVLCRLAANGEMSVGSLMEEVGLGQSALSQHLARLRAEGIVLTRRDGQTIWYRVADKRVAQLLDRICELYCG